jgi:phage terminase small subunit
VIITIALSLLQQFCKPKTEQARKAFLNTLAKKVSTNGVEGCPDCLPSKAREKWRKRIAKRAKVKTASVQDRALYCVVMAAQAKQEAAVSGMSSAYEHDEDDDEDT